MTRKESQQAKWSMCPSMHDSVVCLLEVEDIHFTFHDADTDRDSIRSYDTQIMGRFRCHSKTCGSKGWSSKQIAITIRMYPGGRYNARVYHQRCKGCNGLSKPTLDDSYGQRVAYRLMKWSGVEQEQPTFSAQSKGPHEERFCEGCKAGRTL